MNVTDITSVLASSPAAAPRPRSELGKDEFLQLLVTQLRHQDPMNPSNAQEFASQLAQFTSLEQLTNMKETLEQQNALVSAQLEAGAAGTAVSVIGKDIVAQSDQLALGESSTVEFAAPHAGEATLRLYDNVGNEVGTVALGPVAGGLQRIDVSAADVGLPAGAYTMKVEITDANDVVTPASTLMRGRVDGVRYTADGPMLVCGSLMVPLNAVVEVTTAN